MTALKKMLYVVPLIFSTCVNAVELPENYDTAYMKVACAPWDGSALKIIYPLKSDRSRRIEVQLWTSPVVTGTVVLDRVENLRAAGTAVECGSEMECRYMPGVIITVENVSSEGKITGYSVFPSNERHYPFSASVTPVPRSLGRGSCG